MARIQKILIGTLCCYGLLAVGFGLFSIVRNWNKPRIQKIETAEERYQKSQNRLAALDQTQRELTPTPSPTPKRQSRAGKIAIQVSVSVYDLYTTEGQVLSYVERELRSLGDVVLVKAFPDFRVEIVVTGINLGEKHIGSALSLVAIDSYSDEETEILDHDVTICGLNNINEACRDLVTNFDIRVLKPARLSDEFKWRLNPTTKQ